MYGRGGGGRSVGRSSSSSVVVVVNNLLKGGFCNTVLFNFLIEIYVLFVFDMGNYIRKISI